MPVVCARLCRGRQSSFVVCDIAPLSRAYPALSCQLCRNSTMLCHDTSSTSRPKLNRDLECQVATWEPQALSKSVATENSLSRKNSPATRATLSCALGLVCTARLGLVLCGRAFCRGQLCHDQKILYRDRNSPCFGQYYRDIEFLRRNTKPLHLATLCHHIKYSVTIENSWPS